MDIHDVKIARLQRKIAKRDAKIAALERRTRELERYVAKRVDDLNEIRNSIESAVTDALCNVRMIPVFGSRRDSKILSVNISDAPRTPRE